MTKVHRIIRIAGPGQVDIVNVQHGDDPAPIVGYTDIVSCIKDLNALIEKYPDDLYQVAGYTTIQVGE